MHRTREAHPAESRTPPQLTPPCRQVLLTQITRLPAPAVTQPGRAGRAGSARDEHHPVEPSLPGGRAVAGTGLPGGTAVAVATLGVVAVAVLDTQRFGRIGELTGIALALVSLVAALVTRPGDRSLPAMMPPLAFLAAILVAGQLVLPSHAGGPWRAEALLVVDSLGSNAAWVIGATAAATAVAIVRHLVDIRAARRAAGPTA
jgi:hypothetical protein